MRALQLPARKLHAVGGRSALRAAGTSVCRAGAVFIPIYLCWLAARGGWRSHVQHQVQNISDAAGYGVSRSEAAVPATAENIPIF